MIYRTTPYILRKGDSYLVFDSEKAACEYLGVSQCSVASCYRKNTSCKGYEVIRGVSEAELFHENRLRRIWESMHERCEYERHRHFNNYGGRGIRVCEEWATYIPFAKWAFSAGYEDTLTLDRIDNDGNYSPINCRWVTMKEQANNKRTNRIVVYDERAYTLTELAEKIGMNKTTLKERLNNGWSVEEAVNLPIRERKRGYRPSRSARMDGGNNEAN